jgi:hypothetical protein
MVFEFKYFGFIELSQSNPKWRHNCCESFTYIQNQHDCFLFVCCTSAIIISSFSRFKKVLKFCLIMQNPNNQVLTFLFNPLNLIFVLVLSDKKCCFNSAHTLAVLSPGLPKKTDKTKTSFHRIILIEMFSSNHFHRNVLNRNIFIQHK